MDAARQTAHPTRELTQQIDAIVRELLRLRHQIAAQEQADRLELTPRLFGALGHGSWEEYDLQADWQRFPL